MRLKKRTVALALALGMAVPGFPSGTGSGTPGWIRPYLRGLELEKASRLLRAAEQFRRAIRVEPEPKKAVDLDGTGTIDYAPYAHLAHVLARAGAPRSLVEPALHRAMEAGVAPPDQLERLEQLVSGLPEGNPEAWLRRMRRRVPPRPPGTGDAGPPSRGNARTRSPERAIEAAAAPTPTVTSPPTPARTPAPTAVTPRRPSPSPTPTPVPVTISLPVGTAPEITLRVDGRDLGPGVRTVSLPPGRHAVAAVRNGAVLLERVMEFAPGQSLTLLPVAAPTPTPTVTVTPTLPPEIRRIDEILTGIARARWGFIPLAALLLSLILWVRGRRRGDRANPKTIPATGPTVAAPPAGAPSRPSGHPSSLAGRTVGGYELGERLGSGGMATTYRAIRRSDGREVAVKIPHEHCLQDERSRARFLREGRLGEQLHHPNIVRILEADEEDGWPFLAMELVHGRTLRELLRTAGELPVERALDITRQVAEALDYAHAKGVIHRDLKPENLMLEPGGTVRVMDFGIARLEGGTALTATSVFVGTPAYAAPETIEGGTADARADLFALGIVLFEMLEGMAPFADTTPLEQLRRHLRGEFPERDEIPRPLPDALWELIRKLTARDPADRFASAQALLLRIRELERAIEEGRLEP